MSNGPFAGGIDLVPGPQGPPIPANGLRLVTLGGALFTTTDGLTFTSIAGNIPVATPSTAGLMSAAQAAALQGGVPTLSALSGEIDLTQTGTTVLIPAVTGKTFVPNRITYFTSTAGGAFTSAATLSVGQTGALANITASSAIGSSTQFNGGVAGWGLSQTPVGAAFIQGVDTVLTVTIAAVVGTSFKIKVYVVGALL